MPANSQGRNQAFNSAGNVVAAVMMGLIGYFISNRGVFFFVAVLAVPTILSLFLIRPEEIDYKLARGARDGEDDRTPASVMDLLKDRPLMIFLCCSVMFHFANAAMLPYSATCWRKARVALRGTADPRRSLHPH